MSTFKRIAVFPMMHEAQMAKLFLENHDIPAFVRGEQTTGALNGYAMAMGGVSLLVPAELAEEAQELLVAAEQFQMEEIPWDQEQKDEATGEVIPLEKPSALKYSPIFLWVVMPIITAVLLLVVWIAFYFGGSTLLVFFKSLFSTAPK